MERNQISNELVVNADVARTLRGHASERAELLRRLIASVEKDDRIRAGWLWGSFLKGNSDDLSDLDIWLIVTDDAVDSLSTTINAFCSEAGTVVFSGENAHNAPNQGVYFGALIAGSHGLHHLDIYWQPTSLGLIPEQNAFLNRLDVPCPVIGETLALKGEPVTTELEKCRGKIAFVWLMLSVAAKYLARDSKSDMMLLSYPKNSFNETVAILGLESEVGEVLWTASEDVPSKIALLRRVNAKTFVLEEECRRRGLDLSTEANPCLDRYIDLVEGILGFSA